MKAVIAILLAVVAIAAGTQYVQTYGSQYYYPSTYSGYQYVQQPLKYVQQPYVASSAVVQQTVPVTYANQYAVPSYTYGSYGSYPYYNYGSYGLLKK